MVSKEDREAYEEGLRDKRISEEINPMAEFVSIFGPSNRPSDSYPSEQTAYDKGLEGEELDEDKDDDDGGGGGGFCYLTTACVNSKGLPDNCLELRTLRNFRDKILMKDSKGKKAIEEYYKIAPLIIESINEKRYSQSIWDNLHGDIRKAVSLVKSKDFDSAFNHYKDMTLKLKEKYL